MRHLEMEHLMDDWDWGEVVFTGLSAGIFSAVILVAFGWI